MKPISKSEMALMDILWTRAPLLASDIAALVTPEKAWNIRTIKTLLARLVEKDILETQPDGRRYLYSPRLSREEYGAQVLGSLSQQLYKGRSAPLFLHLAKSEDLSDGDIDEITALLETLKSDKGRQS